MTCEDTVKFSQRQWKHYTAECKDLIYKLLIKNPEKRISVDAVIEHPWFAKLDPGFDRQEGVMSPKNSSPYS